MPAHARSALARHLAAMTTCGRAIHLVLRHKDYRVEFKREAF